MELEQLVGRPVMKRKGFYGGLMGMLKKRNENDETVYFINFFDGSYCRVTNISQIEVVQDIVKKNKVFHQKKNI